MAAFWGHRAKEPRGGVCHSLVLLARPLRAKKNEYTRLGMATHVVEREEGEDFSAGPMALLVDAVKNRSQVLVNIRNGRKLLTKVKAFDRHMNMVLTVRGPEKGGPNLARLFGEGKIRIGGPGEGGKGRWGRRMGRTVVEGGRGSEE